jgi:cell division cycle 14
MMLSCGFTAREAMGWLRIMRPGCVIGEQQHYLCAEERARQKLRQAAVEPAASLATYEDRETGAALADCTPPPAADAAEQDGFCSCRTPAAQAKEMAAAHGMARHLGGAAAIAARC